MYKKSSSSLLTGSLALLAPLVASAGTHNGGSVLPGSYAHLPVAFEANRGQSDARVKFLARVQDAVVFLTADEAVVKTQGNIVRMHIRNANEAADVQGQELLPAKVNYYERNHGPISAAAYGQVKYNGVYPGVDLIYHGNDRELEYDFVVHPGADPHRIQLTFVGADGVSIDKDGSLLLRASQYELKHRRPLVYQAIDGAKRTVPAEYQLSADNTVSFRIGNYDHNLPLVIDPVLSYSTYLSGSNADRAWDLTVDSNGSVYVTGSTSSPDFPLSNPVSGFSGSQNVFVTKLSADGSRILYSTFLGEGKGGGDVGTGIVTDGAGNAYVTGYISDPMLLGDAHRAFVAKLNPDGSVCFFNQVVNSSADADERPSEIAIDAAANIYIAGQAGATIPIVNGFQDQGDYFGRGFVVVMDPTGQKILYSTYIGTSTTKANGIAVDQNGYVYVTGNTSGLATTPNAVQAQRGGDDDAFVVKIDPRQSGAASLLYATYLGGSDWDAGNAITVDASGIAVVTGETKSNYAVNNAGFPVTPDAYQSDLALHNYADTHCYGTFEVAFCSDAFLAVLSPDGTQLWYSTYLGGSGPDSGRAITLDTFGRVQITGQACGFFPTTSNATQSTAGSCGTAFLATFDLSQGPAGQLAFSTFLGGTGGDSGQGIGCDPQGNIYVAGWTQSADFPLVNPAMSIGGGNAPSVFVAKFSFGVGAQAQPSRAASLANLGKLRK